jgi:hypothetical protein
MNVFTARRSEVPMKVTSQESFITREMNKTSSKRYDLNYVSNRRGILDMHT